MRNVKPIAFYLTQYHPIPENDKWWGKGFTEWTNVRKSKPQFIGHNQPEIPYKGNYYDLGDIKPMIDQAKMAKKYGLYGFCFYHYWFEGKLLLEKPLEMMLGDKRVDIPFCLCWANETWSRTWDGQDSEILIKQNYDETESSWAQHFDYFYQFFIDERYIKVDGCPMLIIYKPQLITNCTDMIMYWRQLASVKGLKGLYIGFQHFSAFDYEVDKMGFDFGIEFEPWFTANRKYRNSYEEINRATIANVEQLFRKGIHKIFHKPFLYSYDLIWHDILNRKPNYSFSKGETKVIPGAYTAWDNTPRRGKDSAVFAGAKPSKFGKYLFKQLIRADKIYESDYLFINAWNEWAEGAHLEPDEKYGFGYLENLSMALKNFQQWENI